MESGIHPQEIPSSVGQMWQPPCAADSANKASRNNSASPLAMPTRRGQLFHWRRENGRAGEIDFVLECDGLIVPVETKSGASGAMKSLHQFLQD
jgi:hypothetical protein